LLANGLAHLARRAGLLERVPQAEPRTNIFDVIFLKLGWHIREAYEERGNMTNFRVAIASGITVRPDLSIEDLSIDSDGGLFRPVLTPGPEAAPLTSIPDLEREASSTVPGKEGVFGVRIFKNLTTNCLQFHRFAMGEGLCRKRSGGEHDKARETKRRPEVGGEQSSHPTEALIPPRRH
jgi:hypothetical protein